MKDLVEVIAKALVDNPDEVSVTQKADGKKRYRKRHKAARGQHCHFCAANGSAAGNKFYGF